MRLFLGTCVLFMLVKSYWMLESPPSVVEVAFLSYDIVPDVVLSAPELFVRTEFSGGVQAILGNILTLNQVQNQPNVSWPTRSFSYYTLALVDPDALSRQNPNISEVKHWLVGNIRTNKVNDGEILASYLPPATPAGTGFHRYTIVVFKQKQKLTFDEPRILEPTLENRTKFSIYNFSQKYNLGNPLAGNFFLTQGTNEDC